MSARVLAAALPVVLTLWPSRREPFGRQSSMTWDRFVARFVADPESANRKDRVAGFALASFAGRRALANVEKVFALVLDFDDGDTTLEQAALLFPRTRAAVYTTFSSTPAKPKLRLILPFTRPVSADEYARIWLWAEGRCTKRKRTIDASTRDPSRLWFIPSHAVGCTTYAWRELPGRPVDVAKVLAAAPPLPLIPVRLKRGNGPARARRTQEVAEGMGAPANESFWGRAFELAGMALATLGNGQVAVVCPWESEHTGGDTVSSTVILPPTEDGWGIFLCRHAHCAKRRTLDLLDVLPAPALEAARIEHGSGLVRARVVRGFVQHLDAHDGLAALDRFMLWCEPVGGGAGFRWTVKLSSEAHRALQSLSLGRLLGRRVDVAMRGSEVTWAKLVPDKLAGPKTEQRARASSILAAHDPGAAVVGADFDFLSALLRRYPRAAEKIGPGIRKIRVRAVAARSGPGKCFEAECIDGSRVEFSFLKCLNARTRRTDLGHLGETAGARKRAGGTR